MQYRLRTLLIVLAIGPPFFAGVWSILPKAADMSGQRVLSDFDKLIDQMSRTIRPDSWDDVGGPASIDVFSTTGCFALIEVNDDPAGPDPCGRACVFVEYASVDDHPYSVDTMPVAQQTDDPFATHN